MAFTVNKIGDPIGAEIIGFNIANLEAALDSGGEIMEAIEAVVAKHSVVVFRDQVLTPEHQLAFARRFGNLEINAFDAYALDGHPGLLKISNIRVDGVSFGYADAGSFWHTDMSYTETPPRLTMLCAIEIPERDGAPIGDTLFASAVHAYEALPASTKKRIDDLQAVHHFAAKKRGVKKAVVLSDEQVARYPPVTHPVARTHPATGRKALYVTANECTGIEDMEETEAQALIEELSKRITRPEFQYRHRWRVGDLLIWDNCAVQHVVVRDYEWPRDRRLLHRATVNGSVPF